MDEATLMALIKVDIKNWLNIGDEDDDVLDFIIKASINSILDYCKRTIDDLETKPTLRDLITYDAIIEINKRGNEGVISSNTAGFSKQYGIEDKYKRLLNSCRKAKCSL